VVADPTERLARRPPELRRDVDRDRRRLVLGQLGDVAARKRPLREQRATVRVAPEQAHRTAAAPELERLGFMERLVVPGPRDLEHGVVADGRDEGITRERERRTELQPPLPCDRLGRRLRVREIDRRHATENKWGPRLRHLDPHCLATAARMRGQPERSACDARRAGRSSPPRVPRSITSVRGCLRPRDARCKTTAGRHVASSSRMI